MITAPDADHASLYGRLVEVATAAPNAQLAVVGSRGRLTYRQLVEESSAFGRDLDRTGVASGARIAILLGNGIEFLLAAFGVWAHRSIVLPLSIQLRPGELRHYLQEHSISTLVTSPRAEALVRMLIEEGVGLTRVWYCNSRVRDWTCEHQSRGPAARQEESPDRPGADSHEAALTQYSTGSTGLPRSITRSHPQILGEVGAVSSVLGVCGADRILGLPPFHHSYGLIVSALTTLLGGATLYVPDTFLPSTVGRMIESERISGFPGVPTMFQLLCERRDTNDFSSLRFVLSAGAPLPRSVADAFETQRSVAIRALYGTTETGVICIRGPQDADGEGCVGRAIPGVSISIVDELDAPVPFGETGLVRVRSPFAARGHDGGPECADSRFIADAFVPGDLGRLDPTGNLILSGRQRRFINVNGLKVDPVEVERTLLQIPGVSEAAVIGVADDTSGELVKAVLAAALPPSEQAVRAHCARHLAPFKCPRIVEFRRELPRNSLGKLLRKDLL